MTNWDEMKVKMEIEISEIKEENDALFAFMRGIASKIDENTDRIDDIKREIEEVEKKREFRALDEELNAPEYIIMGARGRVWYSDDVPEYVKNNQKIYEEIRKN